MDYSWVVLSLVAAFTLATSDALTKKALATHNEYIIAWLRLVFALPLLLALFFFIPIPTLNKNFYIAFTIALPLELLSIVMYIKALRLSPLSLTLPFLALTPIFLIFVSYVILGEKVSLWGSVGILFVAAGGYTLNIHRIREGVLEPLKAITREKGSLLMIGVAFIYSITSAFGKMAIEHSSPLFFAVTYFVVLTLCLTPIALYKCWDVNRKAALSALLPGFFYAVMVVSHMVAISLAKVAYVISVKRMSLIIGVLYGYLLFREEKIRERFVGALLMFIGFVMVVTAR